MNRVNSFQERKRYYISPQIALVEEEFEGELLAGSVYGSGEDTDTQGGDKDPKRAKPMDMDPYISIFDDDYEFHYEIPE